MLTVQWSSHPTSYLIINPTDLFLFQQNEVQHKVNWGTVSGRYYIFTSWYLYLLTVIVWIRVFCVWWCFVWLICLNGNLFNTGWCRSVCPDRVQHARQMIESPVKYDLFLLSLRTIHRDQNKYRLQDLWHVSFPLRRSLSQSNFLNNKIPAELICTSSLNIKANYFQASSVVVVIALVK